MVIPDPATMDLRGNLPERSSLSGISVLIVGAGVGGLVACLECWRKGHKVQIVEKSPSRLTSGDHFTIAEQAIRSLRHWPDMMIENEKIAYGPWISSHKLTGEQISAPKPLEYQPLKGRKNDDAPNDQPTRVYRQSRPKFHQMLSRQAEKVGIYVQYGKRVVGYHEDAGAHKAGITLDNGEVIEADIVIAADGVGTKSSKLVAGQEVRARPTGFAILRAAFPVELALADPVVRDRFRAPEDGHSFMEMWIGDAVRCTFWRNEDEFSWTLNHTNLSRAEETWSTTVDPSVALQITATIPGWPDAADRVIKSTPKDRLLEFKLTWRDPQPCWTSPGGHVVQLGDAAHTFLPSAGNGANQAIEDAISLAACLQIAGRENIHWATRVHNTLRFERVACLQKLGVANHETRNMAVMLRRSTASWIWSHNPELYANKKYDEALAHVVDGTPFQNSNVPTGYTYQSWTIDELLALKEAGKEIPLEGDWE